MTQQDNGGPAFPLQPASTPEMCYLGMSLRDWFAGQALGGLILGYTHAYGSPTSATDEIVKEAYRYADAMIAARKVQP
jgi:hypothetical protein